MVRIYFFVFDYFLIYLKYGAIASMLSLFSCQSRQHSPFSSNVDSASHFSQIRHAVGFDLIPFEKYNVLHLFRHYNDAIDTLSFVLKEEKALINPKFKDLAKIEVPLFDIALLHSSYLSFFNSLEATNHLTAISEAQYIYNEQVYATVINESLPEVGFGESLDKEKLLALGVSAVITVGWPNAPNKSQQILGELGIPVLVLSEWQETTLLGRLEWIKVVAALTGKTVLADSLFSAVEAHYDSLKSLTSLVSKRPDIICNLPYKGSWYMPGGNSYVSNVIADAGANYLWSDHPGTGGIQIDFEAVYAKGISADYWINPGFASSIADIVGSDERLSDFQAVTYGHVYNSNKRVSRDIANDYWESGIVMPDVILADLVSIFHPKLLPDHELFYYKVID